jgi:glycosyltransferase involved in cell wall biosynthesis
VLLDFANRGFEHDVALKVLTPLEGPLVKILNKIGVPTDVLPAPSGLRKALRHDRWYLPPALLGLARWARALRAHPFVQQADVVYTVALRAHMAASLARLHPVVWHVHRFPPPVTGLLWRWIARHGPDSLIMNSTTVGRAWAARGAVTVIHNGVNLDRFKPRERTKWIHEQLGIPRDHRLLGMPSVYARWKGQLEVIEAFELIQGEFPDVHLVIVGGRMYDTVAEHELDQQLQRVTGEFRVVTSGESGTAVGDDRGGGGEGADAARIQNILDAAPPHSVPRVHLLPFQREIELAYPEFDLTLHYSVRPEPFGRVILESMACAVPIVAAGEAGPVEILGDGIGPRRQAGWLAEPRNPEALARILRSALLLPTNVLGSVGSAGRLRAEDHFSSRAFAARVARVLHDAVRSTRP